MKSESSSGQLPHPSQMKNNKKLSHNELTTEKKFSNLHLKHSNLNICRIDEESSADECGKKQNIEESKNNFDHLS